MQLDRSLSHVLAKVFRQHNRAYGRALEPLGLTTLHAHILAILFELGPMRVGELQRRLALSSSTFTGALDRMQKLGLLSRERDPDDGRAYRVVPAPMPRAKREKLVRTLAAAEVEAFDALSDRERSTLRRLLGKVAARMDEVERDLGW